MTIYILCPKYVESRISTAPRDLSNALYRHFLPDTPCRVAVDSTGYVLDYLSQKADSLDALRHFIDQIADNGNADQSLEKVQISGATDYASAIDQMTNILGASLRILCYSATDYTHATLATIVDRLHVRTFMETDCALGNKNSMTFNISGNSNSAITVGDDNQVYVNVQGIDADKFDLTNAQRQVILEGIEKAVSAAANGAASEAVLEELSALKAQLDAESDAGFLSKLKSVGSATAPWLAAVAQIVAAFSGA